MKLIYVASARIPSEKAHPYQILKMSEAFEKSNVDTTLALTFRFQTNKKLKQIKDIWSYYGIEKRFKIIKLPCLDLVYFDIYTTWASSIRFLIRQISFGISSALYSIFKRADVYYTRDRFFAYSFGSTKFLHGKKMYYEVHMFESSIAAYIKKGWIDGLIVITQKLKERYIREGISEKKILVAPDGVDLKMFGIPKIKEDVRNELEIPLNKKIICYSGHLYDWKGADVLAKGTKHLPDNFITYFIGGTEEDISKFKDFIKSNEISNAVVVGHVPPMMVPKYLAASDVLVLPNIKKGLSEYTSPLKLFEYMASKRPIVASDLQTIREILNEENAVLVEPGNPKEVADGTKKVLENEELAERITEKAYEDVQQYDWRKRAERILDFVKRGM